MTSDPSTVITSLSGHVLVERYLAAGQRLAQEPRYHTGGTTVDALVAAARDGWALSNGEGEGLTAVRAAAGYTADLDGRSGQVMIEVDNALRPVKSRREGARVDLNDTELHGEVALEALDNYVRRLRTPIGDARRDAAALRPLVAVLVQALEALPESAKVSIDLIMSALELSANEANVVADVLIAVKPALARACGVTSF